MEKELNYLETHEQVEQTHHAHHQSGWIKYLSLTTALVAVLAAIASLHAGKQETMTLLAKNDAIISQAKASDQWSYYQAKGVKKTIVEILGEQSGNLAVSEKVKHYEDEQKEIKLKAEAFEKKSAELNKQADEMFEQHHKGALAVTFYQIAIAMSAMAALLKRKSFWFGSLGFSFVGLVYFVMSL